MTVTIEKIQKNLISENQISRQKTTDFVEYETESVETAIETYRQSRMAWDINTDDLTKVSDNLYVIFLKGNTENLDITYFITETS